MGVDLALRAVMTVIATGDVPSRGTVYWDR